MQRLAGPDASLSGVWYTRPPSIADEPSVVSCRIICAGTVTFRTSLLFPGSRRFARLVRGVSGHRTELMYDFFGGGLSGRGVTHWVGSQETGVRIQTGRKNSRWALTEFANNYDTIRDAILTCARKPTWVSLIHRTEPTTKSVKTEKLKVEKRYAQKWQ